jgi:hypothetical protein
MNHCGTFSHEKISDFAGSTFALNFFPREEVFNFMYQHAIDI